MVGRDGVVPTEIVAFSSEDPPFAARKLHSGACASALQKLLHASEGGDGCAPPDGWQSEKFCEYPQELVFRVDSAQAARGVDSLVLVSHPTLIATRVEIFLSSSLTRTWRRAHFERLGFVTLQSPQETQCAVQELKTVPLRDGAAGSTLTYLRLLVHRCHIHTANVFNQVGLTCVVALFETGERSIAATLRTLVSQDQAPDSTQASDMLAVRPWPMASPPKKKPPLSSPSAYSIWIADSSEYTTPSQLLTRIQLARERHAVVVKSTVRSEQDAAAFAHEQRLWAVDERTCSQLSDQLGTRLDAESRARTVGDRLAIRSEIESVVRSLQELDSRVRQREAAMQRQVSSALATQLANSPVKNANKAMVVSPPKATVFRHKDTWAALDHWQAREECLWKVVDAVKCWGEQSDLWGSRTLREQDAEDPTVLNEALDIAATGLLDAHAQVFIAATALLKSALPLHPRFQCGTAWKTDVRTMLTRLVRRLDDLQPAVRNNAAFSIVKLAELTHARGSFVVHHLLVMAERPNEIQLTGQTLHGLLKVCSALLLAFHCCAQLDISYKRVLKMVLNSDALRHENGHVREAARQLLVVLHDEVGGDVIVEHFRKRKLPAEEIRPIEDLFAAVERKSLAVTTNEPSLDGTPAVL